MTNVAQERSDVLYITAQDAACRYGLPPRWFHRKAQSGEIPSHKLGMYRRFKVAELDEYMERIAEQDRLRSRRAEAASPGCG